MSAAPLGLAVAAALHTLYSAFCSFTWFKYALYDFGVYTNMIWNSGRGQWFRTLVDRDYLATHLSFTLALLGPLFRVWDHPFLLAVVQWLCLVGGGLILWAAGRRHQLPESATATVLFFLAGYRLTQATLLSEFHGVGVYYLLVPWLYHALSFRPRAAWLPLALILGVREDAFILVLPMLAYFAARGRGKTGYLLIGLAVAYGLMAVFWLYPALVGFSLFDRRQNVIPDEASDFMKMYHLRARLQGLMWVLLPAAAWWGRHLLPVLLFPLSTLLTAMLSGFPTQQMLGSHYGGAAAVSLAVGMIEALARRRGNQPADRPVQRDSALRLRLVFLAAVVIAAHVATGFLWLGGKHDDTYARPKLRGVLALEAARHIPRTGILLTTERLAGLCANRAEILSHREYRPERHRVDHLFLQATGGEALDADVRRRLETAEMGVHYYDGDYLVLSRAADPDGNAEFLASYHLGPIRFIRTGRHAGRNRRMSDGTWVRYWNGDGRLAPVEVSCDTYRQLAPGDYELVFTYRAAAPRRAVCGHSGWVSVHPHKSAEQLGRHDLRVGHAADETWRTERLRFTVREPGPIEFRVTAGDARLWLRDVRFVPVAGKPGDAKAREAPARGQSVHMCRMDLQIFGASEQLPAWRGISEWNIQGRSIMWCAAGTGARRYFWSSQTGNCLWKHWRKYASDRASGCIAMC